MVLASTVALGFGPRWDPWPYFCSFQGWQTNEYNLRVSFIPSSGFSHCAPLREQYAKSDDQGYGDGDGPRSIGYWLDTHTADRPKRFRCSQSPRTLEVIRYTPIFGVGMQTQQLCNVDTPSCQWICCRNSSGCRWKDKWSCGFLDLHYIREIVLVWEWLRQAGTCVVLKRVRTARPLQRSRKRRPCHCYFSHYHCIKT
jgi:hypothetical protein